MPKPIPFYNEVDSYSAVEFLTKLDEAAGEDVLLCISSNGGYTSYAMGMVERWQNYPGKKNVMVHGGAHSVMALFLCFVSGASALETASFVLHRGHYGEWFENSEWFTQDLKDDLARWNAFAKKSFEAKIDAKKFEELKGISLKEIFTAEKVIDVRLTAKEAKAVGLIESIVKLTPEVKAEISAIMQMKAGTGYQRMVALVNQKVEVQNEESKEKNNPKNKIMTVEEFKAQHPAEYAKAFKAGVDKERDRVNAIMVYNDVDPEGVKAIVKSGDDMTQTQMAEFGRKIQSQAFKGKITEDSKRSVETPAAETQVVSEADKKKAKFEETLDEKLGLSKKA